MKCPECGAELRDLTGLPAVDIEHFEHLVCPHCGYFREIGVDEGVVEKHKQPRGQQ